MHELHILAIMEKTQNQVHILSSARLNYKII